MLRCLMIGVLSALAGAGFAEAQTTKSWIGSWAAAPYAVGRGEPFAGRTLRQVVRLSAGGSQVRLRLSNEFGSSPLTVGAAHVALADADGAVLPGTDRTVTFSGAESAVIGPGAPLISDPVDLAALPLARLVISLFLPAAAGPCTCHGAGLATGYLSAPGDFTGAEAFTPDSTFTVRPFLTGVDVSASAGGQTIVALGDSLTDGVSSTRDADRRWPDRLAERLATRGGRPALGVIDLGIGGNQVLAEHTGPSALARFDRDVLAAPGAAYLILFEGINDLGFEPKPPADAAPEPAPAPSPTALAVMAADRQIIVRAHSHGIKVFGATLTPYQGSFLYTAQGEIDRQAINAWIRASGAFDGVIDFDRAWSDPDNPGRLLPAFDAGDHLHGDDAGYRALGDAVGLSLFR
ncbi:MAG TPA: SGNH/GDSL hydrolase family protein [Caulobacteraceae bacterium]|nr:SGNH/GDSL hydrolase family protein [Caulobacteraceae bacterium]